MVGHKLLVKNFKNLVEAEKLSHGYIFFGADGVGKKTFALSLANFLENKEFFYEDGSVNVGDFENKKHVIFSDLLLIEPNENRTIGIDVVRELKNFLTQRPNKSPKRTAIIDEAEFLTTEAQNALLKIAEEPPASSLLVLIAREPEIFVATLGSRLQKIYFAPVKISDVEEWLEKSCSTKHVVCSREELRKIAEKSMGKPGLAFKILKDEKFQATSKLAEKFLKISGSNRKDFLKELLEPEDFDILGFLDAVILQITNHFTNLPTGRQVYEPDGLRKQEKEIKLWHKVLRLRQDFSNFPLNPKLQLLNL